jgi:parallel beta-helix repeat protein
VERKATTVASIPVLLVLILLVTASSMSPALAGIDPSPSSSGAAVSPQASAWCDSCADCTSKLASGSYSTVTLTTDITDWAGSCISLISSSNSSLTFDCDGHTIDGDDIGGDESLDAGIEMMYGSNNVVQGCTITDFDIGIYFWTTTGNTARDIVANSNVWGIRLQNGGSATVEDSTFDENKWGISLSNTNSNNISSNSACQNSSLDIDLSSGMGNMGDYNSCDKPGSWNDQGATGCTWGCAGSATCISCSDCTSKLTGAYETVLLTQDITDHSGSCINFGAGDVIFDCDGHTLDGNDTFGDGISVYGYSGNTVRNCTVTDFYDGIYLYGADSTTLDHNTVSSNTSNGIYLFNSDSNSILSSDVGANTGYGLLLSSSSDHNQLSANKLRCNSQGIGFVDSGDNTVNASTICSAPGHDFESDGYSPNNSGSSNRCDMPNGWNDGGTTGCTTPCNGERCSTCSDGMWGYDEDGVDCGGRYCPPCAQCSGEPTTKYAPPDTICNNAWPTTDGVLTGLKDTTYSCNVVEVCNPDLDYIIHDALLCCEYTDYPGRLLDPYVSRKETACDYAHAQAYRHNFAANFNPTSLEQCLGHYIIRSLERSAVYMQDYFHGELCCYGFDGCPSTCDEWKVSPPAWEMGSEEDCRSSGSEVDFYMDGHLCRSYSMGIFGRRGVDGYWNSDTDFEMNNDSFSDPPTHASINRLSTGTCADYSLALTTLLRKAGYSKDRVLSAEGVRHAYNLVRFPGETKWHYVDTTGNNAGGVYGGAGFPSPATSWYTSGGDWRYCSGLTDGCMNDVYSISRERCPPNDMILGCEGLPQLALSSPDLPPPSTAQSVAYSPLAADVDQTCTELNPCIQENIAEVHAPGPELSVGGDKSISSPEIVQGQAVEITIQVENLEPTDVDVLLQETFILNVEYELDREEMTQDGITIEQHRRWLTVPAHGTEVVAFAVAPTEPGYYDFPSTRLLAGDRTYETNPVRVKVLCDPNGLCDPGENFVFCPADCPTGVHDDYCDMVSDGVQDPDCEYGVDPDFFPFSDTDGDGTLDAFDACAQTPSGDVVDVSGCSCSQQICDDGDASTVDGCDSQIAWCTFRADADQDGIADAEDNCPTTYNPDQADSNTDGVGDACAIGPINGNTILEPGRYVIAAPDSGAALVVSSSGVTLNCDGATITGDGSGYGIYVAAPVENVVIANCTVENYHYGIYVDGAAGVQLYNNALEDNDFGLVFANAVDSILIDNIARGNRQAGLYLEGSTECQITGNTLSANLNRGVYLHTSVDNDLSNNTICNNTVADLETYDSVGTGGGNTCDVATGWSDEGATGCASACVGHRNFLPLILRQAQ